MPDSRTDGNVRSVKLGIFAEDMKYSEYGIPVKTAKIGGESPTWVPKTNALFSEEKTAPARVGRRLLTSLVREAS